MATEVKFLSSRNAENTRKWNKYCSEHVVLNTIQYERVNVYSSTYLKVYSKMSVLQYKRNDFKRESTSKQPYNHYMLYTVL